MSTVVSAEIGEAEWDAFVASQPDAVGYHQWGWHRVIERAFGHETCYLAARRGGAVVGVLPLALIRSWIFGSRAVSLPFLNYGGVLAHDGQVAQALLEGASAVARARGATYLELRHFSQTFPQLPAKHHKVTMLLPLARDEKTAWAALDGKVRNQVRKAEKSGLTAAVGGAERLDDFYRVFAVNMRDLGTPVYSRGFFEQMFEWFPQSTRVYIVRDGSKPVAAGIRYIFRTTAEVPWASSLREYRSASPNNLLYWSVIREAIAENLSTLDFGRSTPNEGTYHFKKQWGAQPLPLCWEYVLLGRDSVPDESPRNPKYRLAIAAWKRLPVSIATRLGPHIVRSIP